VSINTPIVTHKNGQIRQTPEAPRQDMEVPRRPEQIIIQLGWFLWLELFEM
jgi:hypothetical protein